MSAAISRDGSHLLVSPRSQLETGEQLAEATKWPEGL